MNTYKKTTINSNILGRGMGTAALLVALTCGTQAAIEMDTVGSPEITGSWTQKFTLKEDGKHAQPFNEIQVLVDKTYNKNAYLESKPADSHDAFTFSTSSWTETSHVGGIFAEAKGTATKSLTFDLNFGGKGGPYDVRFILVDRELVRGCWQTYDMEVATYCAKKNTWTIQDVGCHNDTDLTPVPEPSTLIAGSLALIPLGIRTLRKMRKNYTA